MSYACRYLQSMLQVLKIRNVPDSVHRTLKPRAAMAGMSLSDFLLAEIRGLAARPTIVELRERVRSRSRIATGVSTADAVRCERDGP